MTTFQHPLSINSMHNLVLVKIHPYIKILNYKLKQSKINGGNIKTRKIRRDVKLARMFPYSISKIIL